MSKNREPIIGQEAIVSTKTTNGGNIMKNATGCKLILPDVIEKKYVHMAHKLIITNSEGRTIDVHPDALKRKYTQLTTGDVFIGYIPISWLVPIEEK